MGRRTRIHAHQTVAQCGMGPIFQAQRKLKRSMREVGRMCFQWPYIEECEVVGDNVEFTLTRPSHGADPSSAQKGEATEARVSSNLISLLSEIDRNFKTNVQLPRFSHVCR